MSVLETKLNREKVAKVYNLRKVNSHHNSSLRSLIYQEDEVFKHSRNFRDNTEYYRTAGCRYAVVFSPTSLDDEERNFILKNGYVQIEPFESHCQLSFLKVFQR
jgi:hypothetical protein